MQQSMPLHSAPPGQALLKVSAGQSGGSDAVATRRQLKFFPLRFIDLKVTVTTPELLMTSVAGGKELSPH